MIGGDRNAFEHLEPVFQTLAPGPDRGYGYVGGPGAGYVVSLGDARVARGCAVIIC